MRITIAKHSGYCYGVKRALDILPTLAGKTAIFGHLIHNKQVMEKIKSNGIDSIDKLSKLKNYDNIVITAHGISDKKLNQIRKHAKSVINVTCPFVIKVHNITKDLEKRKFKVIIIGDKDHVEVKGIAGNLRKPIIVNNEQDIKKIKKIKQCGVVSQTTQNKQKFNFLVDKLRTKCDNLEIHNTICSATEERQNSALELAKKVDLMLVVGGYHSANTKRLKELCSRITETQHIETAADLQQEWLKNKNHVGIIGGASTPDWIMREIINKLPTEPSFSISKLIKNLNKVFLGKLWP